MHSLTLVYKNLSRRKGRSVLSLLGLVLAVAVIVSTFTISRAMELQVGVEIEKYGPNIVVMPKTQSISVPYGNVVVGDVTIPESSVDKIYLIQNKRNLRVLSPKLYGQVEYKNNSMLVVGLVSEKEIELKRWWNVVGSWPQNDTDEIVVGSVLRHMLALEIGTIIQVKNVSLSVVGFIGETGSVDDYSVFMSLHRTQSFLNLVGQVSVIDVGALCNDCPVEEISRQIMDVLPDAKAIPVKQAVETKMTAVGQMASFSLLLASIILAVGCVGIMNTMLASVHERTREIGIFMSFGADDKRLFSLFFLESLILGFVGGAVGVMAGLISSVTLGPVFAKVAITIWEIPLFTIPLALFLSIIACLVASLYPAWRVSKVDPVKALKAV